MAETEEEDQYPGLMSTAPAKPPPTLAAAGRRHSTRILAQRHTQHELKGLAHRYTSAGLAGETTSHWRSHTEWEIHAACLVEVVMPRRASSRAVRRPRRASGGHNLGRELARSRARQKNSLGTASS